MTAAYRLGIYGGAFDPPHLAHIALAKAAVAQFELSELRIIPTGNAWHKNRTLSAAAHRLAMAALAFEEIPQVYIDPRETTRLSASYTIDTLLALRQENPLSDLFLLMGQDQWALFPQWHRNEEIAQIATILVAPRADSARLNAKKGLNIHDKIPYQEIQTILSPVSSTQIRRLCAGHASIAHLVKHSVAKYIDDHGLYRAS